MQEQPTKEQRLHAEALLALVTKEERRDWASKQGQAFLAYVAQLADEGVSITEIAEVCGIAPKNLYTQLRRFRIEGMA